MVALAGIGFAVVLMFMQMGFRNALFDSTVKVVTDLDADLLLVNQAQYALPARQSFDLQADRAGAGLPRRGGASIRCTSRPWARTGSRPAAASRIRSACWPSTRTIPCS